MKLSQLPIVGRFVRRYSARIAERTLTDYQAAVIAAADAVKPVEVPARLLSNCRIVPDRAAMLETLPRGGIWCEVGTAEGDFAQQILTICHPDRLHLVDSWSDEHDPRYAGMEEAVKLRFRGQPVYTHRGYSTDVLENAFQDDYLDVIYIDAGHGYHDTVAELELARQKVKPGGLIAGHDYVLGSWRSHARFGVIEAVNGFCVKYNLEFVLVTWECHQHRSYVLREVE